MALDSILQIASTGMSAQSIRLNIAASNLANANTLSDSEKTAFRARQPVFTPLHLSEKNTFNGMVDAAIAQGVKVTHISKSDKAIQSDFQPGNPNADDKGYVYKSNVNTMEEMANIVEASRDYERNIQVMLTAKKLIEHTLKLAE